MLKLFNKNPQMFPHFWDTLYRKRFMNVSLCGTKRNIFRKIFSIWDEKIGGNVSNINPA